MELACKGSYTFMYTCSIKKEHFIIFDEFTSLYSITNLFDNKYTSVVS